MNRATFDAAATDITSFIRSSCVTVFPSPVFARGLLDFRSIPSGLIIPLDDESMYVHPDGQIEIRYQKNTDVAIKLNYGAIREMSDTTIRFENHKALENVGIKLPAIQALRSFLCPEATGHRPNVKFRPGHGMEKCNLHIYCKPIPDNLPKVAGEAFSGKFFFSDDKRSPARLVIRGKTYGLLLNKSRETLIHDVWVLSNCAIRKRCLHHGRKIEWGCAG